MKKSLSNKRSTVKELHILIRESRKMARQINRKLESLAQINKAKTAAKNRLIEICGLK